MQGLRSPKREESKAFQRCRHSAFKRAFLDSIPLEGHRGNGLDGQAAHALVTLDDDLAVGKISISTSSLLEAGKDVVVYVEDTSGLDATDATNDEEDRGLHLDTENAGLGPHLMLVSDGSIVEASLGEHDSSSMVQALLLGARLLKSGDGLNRGSGGVGGGDETIGHSIVSDGSGGDEQGSLAILGLEGTAGTGTDDDLSSSLQCERNARVRGTGKGDV